MEAELTGMLMTRSDVTVQQIDAECGECTRSIERHYYVCVDFRAVGMTENIGPYCKPCAEKIAKRIQDGLPK